MGDRGVITTHGSKGDLNRIGVYLHWNGAPDQVEGLLCYCYCQGYRNPEDDCYGWARFCQVAGNYIGGDLSLGVDTLSNLDCDNWDNGTYIIKNWQIVERVYGHNDSPFLADEQTLYEFVSRINKTMPQSERLDDKIIRQKVHEYWESKRNIIPQRGEL